VRPEIKELIDAVKNHHACACREEKIQRLVAILEAVRSQMCWEQDRDQLTMGFQDLHKGVTEALAEWREEQVRQ